MGLGHAYEIDPWLEDSFLLEIAQAQLVRQIFDRHPIKWMPPTKYKTGDIFQSHVHDAMFNLVGVTTDQSIELLGMFSEADPHTAAHGPLPLAEERRATSSARRGTSATRSSGSRGGIVERRAREVLDEAHELLARSSRRPSGTPSGAAPSPT